VGRPTVMLALLSVVLTRNVLSPSSSLVLQSWHDTDCPSAERMESGVPPLHGVVMGGADVVAYFSLPAGALAVMGSQDHMVDYAGYIFYFANASTRAIFAEEPGQFIPAYGGFCAFGTCCEGSDHNENPEPVLEMRRNNELANVTFRWSANLMGPPCDANAWLIVAGRLFCTGNPVARDFFTSDPKYEAYADARWTAWFGGLDQGPMNTQCFKGNGTEDAESCEEGPCVILPNRTRDYKYTQHRRHLARSRLQLR